MTYWTKFYSLILFLLIIIAASLCNIKRQQTGVDTYTTLTITLTGIAIIFGIFALVYNYRNSIFDGRYKIDIHDVGRELTWHRKIWIYSDSNTVLYRKLTEGGFRALYIHAWPAKEAAVQSNHVFSEQLTSISTIAFLKDVYELMSTYKEDIYISFYCDAYGDNSIVYEVREIFANYLLFLRIFGVIVTNKFLDHIAKITNMPPKEIRPFLSVLRGELSAFDS